MELLIIVLITVWAKTSAVILVREAPDAETQFWRAAISAGLLGLWAFACIDIIPSPFNRLGEFFPSNEILYWSCAVVGAVAGLAIWGAGRFVKFGRASARLLAPIVFLLAPFAYRFITEPRSNWPVERLILAVSEGSPRTAQRAVTVLGEKGAPAVGALVDALRVSDLRIQAIDSLTRIGEPAVEPLRSVLSATPEMSAAAAEALGKIGPAARGTVPELAALVDGPVQGPRLAAIDALGRMGPSALFGIPALERAAKTEPRAQAALRKVATAEAIRALKENQRRE